MSVEDVVLTLAFLLAAGLAAEPVARVLRPPASSFRSSSPGRADRRAAAALAGIMVSPGVPDACLIVICVALAVILTLALQTTTESRLARRLGPVGVGLRVIPRRRGGGAS